MFSIISINSLRFRTPKLGFLRTHPRAIRESENIIDGSKDSLAIWQAVWIAESS